MKPGLFLAGLLTACFAGAQAAKPARAAGYPTADRVVYVEDCMQKHKGPHFEMINKCSCVLDTLASQLPYDDFVTMTTATNANSIGGERGGVIRDTEVLQKQIRRFRDLQAAAQKKCFISQSGPVQ